MDGKETNENAIWLRQLSRGDQAAWRQLVDTHYTLIYSIARSHVKQNETAEELAQDVFLRLYLHRHRIETVHGFLGKIPGRKTPAGLAG